MSNWATASSTGAKIASTSTPWTSSMSWLTCSRSGSGSGATLRRDSAVSRTSTRLSTTCWAASSMPSSSIATVIPSAVALNSTRTAAACSRVAWAWPATALTSLPIVSSAEMTPPSASVTCCSMSSRAALIVPPRSAESIASRIETMKPRASSAAASRFASRIAAAIRRMKSLIAFRSFRSPRWLSRPRTHSLSRSIARSNTALIWLRAWASKSSSIFVTNASSWLTSVPSIISRALAMSRRHASR